MFNLFSIQDRFIQDSYGNSPEAAEERADYRQGEQLADELAEEENISLNVSQPENFLKVDNEYEKKFGRLYKTFDVKFLKSKIWDSINNLDALGAANPGAPEQRLGFGKVVGSVAGSLSHDVIKNISTPTCFVCLLHLSNEKSK